MHLPFVPIIQKEHAMMKDTLNILHTDRVYNFGFAMLFCWGASRITQQQNNDTKQ